MHLAFYEYKGGKGRGEKYADTLFKMVDKVPNLAVCFFMPNCNDCGSQRTDESNNKKPNTKMLSVYFCIQKELQ